MVVIGLTGGIGSGKSAVSSYLIKKGYKVIDADKIARDVVAPGSPALSELALAFGADVINEDKTLNRRKLAGRAFSDDASKALLDRITHGPILAAIRAEIAASRDEAIVFLDAPLLFETGLDRLTNLVWVVDADEAVRIRRVVKRDGLTAEDVQARIRQQMPSEDKKNRADCVIDNSGSLESLYEICDRLLDEFGANGDISF